MSEGPRYFVPFRRRREGRTDYYKRTHLVVADRPRMVVRRTNRYIIVQLVEAGMEGDRTLVAANSKELALYGFLGSASILLLHILRECCSAYVHSILTIREPFLTSGSTEQHLVLGSLLPCVVQSRRDLTYLTEKQFFLTITG